MLPLLGGSSWSPRSGSAPAPTEAEPGQILTSNVVQELAAGKGFDFADKGEATLKDQRRRHRPAQAHNGGCERPWVDPPIARFKSVAGLNRYG